MKTVYFDCLSGASGDMILGALVDAGVPLEHLQQTAAALQLPGLRLEAQRVKRHDLGATKVEVRTAPEKRHRHLHHIQEIITRAALPAEVSRDAMRVFQRLAEAEARVHQNLPERIHFHEVGAVDAIADVVCAVAGLHFLKAQEAMVSVLPLGGGTVRCEHGLIPVPAPATVELVRGFPARPGPIEAELVTPTGAAILTTLAVPYDQTAFRITAVGCGAGSREHVELPNVLRLFVGEKEGGEVSDTITLVETNIDDMNPEIYPFVLERLLERGALDAFCVPVIMKKGRPGILLTALVPAGRVEEVLEVIYSETTTLGVRLLPVARRKLRRWHETRTTSLGPVSVKVAAWRDQLHLAPEFEECQRLAREKNLPLREVYELLHRELRTATAGG